MGGIDSNSGLLEAKFTFGENRSEAFDVDRTCEIGQEAVRVVVQSCMNPFEKYVNTDVDMYEC